MKRKFDTILLAFSLFCISGAMLFYNLRVAESTGVSASPGELIDRYDAGVIEVFAAAQIAHVSDEDEPEADTTSVEAADTTEAVLLPPIIRASGA